MVKAGATPRSRLSTRQVTRDSVPRERRSRLISVSSVFRPRSLAVSFVPSTILARMDHYYNYLPEDAEPDPYYNTASDNPFSYKVRECDDGAYDDVDELLDEIGEYMRNIHSRGA